MTDQKISRRDWFRLRKPRQNQLPSSRSACEMDAASPLKPIEQPPNHDGMDLSQLPPMSEAELNREQVDDLFSDIRELGRNVSLMQRGISALRPAESVATAFDQLAAARNGLLSGELTRVQIRYEWDAFFWIDTLEAQGAGAGTYRLVRIRHAGVK